MDRLVAFLAAGFVALPCVGVAPVSAQTPELVPAEACGVALPANMPDYGGVECGQLVVLQDRATDAAGLDLRLSYLRLRAATETDRPPLFMLAGGPGQSIIHEDYLLLFQPELLGPVLAERDVVLMEQRGTAGAIPRLDCRELDGLELTALIEELDEEEILQLEVDHLEACIRRQTEAGVDLAAFNNVESAADVDAMRAALGYETIVLYGASYGTLLAQFVLRDFPDIVDAVILDGTESPSKRSWIEDRALDAQSGIDRVSELYSADPGCAAVFDVPALLDAAFEMFDEGPVEVPLPLPPDISGGKSVTLSIGEEDLAQQVYALQTSKYGIAALPLALTGFIEAGREEFATSLARASMASILPADAEAEPEEMLLMHAAMICTDDPPRSPDEIRTSGTGRYAQSFAFAVAQPYLTLCEVLDLPQISDDYDRDVSSDVPDLVLSGGLDVQTPRVFSEDVAGHLPNSTHVVFPDGSHVQVANLNRCAIEIVVDFLADPASEIDRSCVLDTPPFAFVLPDQVE